MLNAHLDTVGVGGMTDPFTPRVEHGRLHGRGAIDTKAGLAVLMTATAAAAATSMDGTVLLTAVADEEYGSIGTEAVAAEFTADAAIVSEPTDLEIVIAHQGFVWFEIETHGVAAHGSRPDLGTDAITMMGPVLDGIATISESLGRRTGQPLLGSGSIHASLINGGQELSSYPFRCVLGLERRTVPGEPTAAAEAELAALVEELRREHPGFAADLRMVFERAPYEIAPDHPFVELVARNAARILAAPPPLSGHLAWMDAALLGAAGIPTVVFGPRGQGLHANEEWVDLDSMHTMFEVVTSVIAEFCGRR